MTFGESIKTCFSKYATFEGRASRSEYWWFFLLTYVGGNIPVVGWIIAIAAFIPSIAVAARRLHDTGHSGWWQLCPIYNLVLLATASDEGANEYGEPAE